MSKPKFNYSFPRWEDAEKRGIALQQSGSYVLKSVDQDELDSLARVEFKKISFSDMPFVVVANSQSSSKRGKVARFARMSADGRFASYQHPVFRSRVSYVSLSLIKGTAYTPAQFIDLIRCNDVIRVRRLHDNKEFRGVIFGSDLDAYSTLLVPTRTPIGFDLVDIETEHNAYNKFVVVSVLGRNLAEDAQIRHQLLGAPAVPLTTSNQTGNANC
jgi:hypothetical protein